MPDWSVILPAVGVLFSIVITAAISYRVASGAAKKSDIETLQAGYRTLQQTYATENERLNNALEFERNARRADKLECQTQIDGLQRQLTVLLTKMPEPGAVVMTKIVGIDTDALPALPVKLTAVQADVILPTEIIRPLPVPMTAAQQAAVKAEAELNKET